MPPESQSLDRIFISYRREDTAAYARLLYDRFAAKFGKDRVFMDLDTLQPGDDFVHAIEQTIATCAVLIAVIGKQWANSTDRSGRRRLDSPNDFVHIEIAAALSNEKTRVVPVTVAGTVIPEAVELPDDLKQLVRRQALDLRDAAFNQDVERLIRSVEGLMAPSPIPPHTLDRVSSHAVDTVKTLIQGLRDRVSLHLATLSLVAAIFLAAVIFYARVWHSPPGQHSAATRHHLLKARAAQIKWRFDDFGPVIVNSTRSYRFGNDVSDLISFRQYLRSYVPTLELLTPEQSRLAELPTDDPPRVSIRRDGGSIYLYVGYRVDGRILIAKADIDEAAAPYLTLGDDFDALILVNHEGQAIAQRPHGMISGIDTIKEVASTDAFGAKPSVVLPMFERLHARSGGVTNVTIESSDYALYSESIRLELEGSDGKSEEWILCGLVRADRVGPTASAILVGYLLWFGAISALLCIAIPLLKFRVWCPWNSMRPGDIVTLSATIFLVVGLSTLTAQDWYNARYVFQQTNDKGLQSVANAIAHSVSSEASAIAGELSRLDDPQVWNQLGYNADFRTFGFEPFRPTIALQDGHYSCLPQWSCRFSVLAHDGFRKTRYPYFKHIVWNDDAGWQLIKWSTSPSVPPFTNLSQAKVSYYDSLKLARRVSVPGSTTQTSGVTALRSTSTDEKLAVFWKALPDTAPDRGSGRARSDLIGEALVTAPLSLTSPMLPNGMQFMVVDAAGLVLFHSEPARVLVENAFDEFGNRSLRSMVQDRQSALFNTIYLDRRHRVFVRPLDVSPFEDPHWTLLVYDNAVVTSAVSVETFAIAGTLIFSYAFVVLIVWGVVNRLSSGFTHAYLSPESSLSKACFAIALLNSGVIITFVVARWIGPIGRAPLLLGTGALTCMAVIGTVLLSLRHTRATQERWRMRAVCPLAAILFLTAVAVLPTLACFQAAYDFRMSLLRDYEHKNAATQRAARDADIMRKAASLELCQEQRSGRCQGLEEYIDQRRDVTWDVDTPLFKPPSQTIEEVNRTGVDRALRRIRTLYPFDAYY